jgi:hypothetical protein
MSKSLPLALSLLCIGVPAVGQTARPIPYPVTVSPEFTHALASGTRSPDGAPGPAYWQQWTDYVLTASLDVEQRAVSGTARLRYHNRSPDILDTLVVHLHHNLHAPGVRRNRPEEVTGGVQVESVVVHGHTLTTDTTAAAFYEVDGTIMTIVPPESVAPGSSVDLAFTWQFTVPQSGARRTGWSDDELFFIAYWYPQMAMYDDLGGWHRDPYLSGAEFAVGFGSYDVTIEAPEGWVVRATGTLENPDAVLTPTVRARLAAAMEADTVVHVLSDAEFGPGQATVRSPSGRLRWHFVADSVRDAVFSASRSSRWDATRAAVGDRDGDGAVDYTRIESLWRERAPLWALGWRYAQHSIDFLSRFTGLPYPWPHMTAVEGGGIRGGGMEYPMMTLIGDYVGRSDTSLYSVTAHELAHMWVPMLIANDEKRHGWIDEGTTSFNDANAQREFYPGSRASQSDRDRYLGRARTGSEGEMMRRTEYHYPGHGGVASYSKPATVLWTLRALVGDDRFLPAYRKFLADWRFKHPQPWDLFNSFSTSLGEDLDWFWRTWYFETWTLDQAIDDVRDGDTPTVVIRDVGLAPLPARVVIWLADGSILVREVPVDHWLDGHRTAEIALPSGSAIDRVAIDPDEQFPDADRSNNVWTRP